MLKNYKFSCFGRCWNSHVTLKKTSRCNIRKKSGPISEAEIINILVPTDILIPKLTSNKHILHLTFKVL